MSNRRECLRNLESLAPMLFIRELVKFGNKHLGHIWDYNESDVLKILECLTFYCIEKGKTPKVKGAKNIMLKRIEWQEGDSGIRLDIWAL